jgi:hypothetical protein
VGSHPAFNLRKRCNRLADASDKVYQLLAHGRWFSPGTPASSITDTGRHDIAEILLKVALSIGRVNIEFFPGWKKIKQRRISFVLSYLRMILWNISTAIYIYGFLNQSLGLILGNIILLK